MSKAKGRRASGRDFMGFLMLTVIVLLVQAGVAHAAVWAPCATDKTLQCTAVTVPLDPTGAVTGSITLHVERTADPSTSAGTVLLLAGGPGQASLPFISEYQGAAGARMFPGQAIATYDQRGTGSSGALSCSALDDSDLARHRDIAAAGFIGATADAASAIAECASQLGTARQFYTSTDSANDMEAVRQALGVDQLTVYGVSYGTLVATVYAEKYPTHVARLLLNSTVPQTGPDVFNRSGYQAIPGSLEALCQSGLCPTKSPVEDLVRVANRLRHPVRVSLQVSPARHVAVMMTRSDLENAYLATDEAPQIGAQFPAALHAAAAGYFGPLARLVEADSDVASGPPTPPTVESNALNLATLCSELEVPWTIADTPADRVKELTTAFNAIPASSFGPLGKPSVDDISGFCTQWPADPRRDTLAAAPVPNVPVLIVEGDLDLRTPIADARNLATLFPQTQFLTVHDQGHGSLESSPCAIAAVGTWIKGGTPPTRCADVNVQANLYPHPFVAALAGVQPDADVKRGRTVGQAKALTAVRSTVSDVLRETFLRLDQGVTSVPVVGPNDGVATIKAQHRSYVLTLTNYTWTDGVSLAGTITVTRAGVSGTLTIRLSHGASGVVHLTTSKLTGTIGGTAFAIARVKGH